MSWTTLPERIEANLLPEPNSGCWLWIGYLSTAGYGRIRYHGQDITAHRLVYELTKSRVPKGLELDHLCRVRCCCNPEHLEPVTHIENSRRGETGKYQLKITQCPKGHLYDEANTYRDAQNRRHCRRCDLLRTWKRRGKL